MKQSTRPVIGTDTRRAAGGTRVVVYLGVSYRSQAECDHIEERYSVAAQYEACRRYLRERGLTLADTDCDRGEGR
jgi:hypothetical protein